MVLSSGPLWRTNTSFFRMSFRTVLGLILFFSFWATPHLNGQTTTSGNNDERFIHSGLQPIAPFINKDTILVVRFDLNRIDHKELNYSLQTLFSEFVDKLDFTDNYAEDCKKEFAVTSETLTKDLESSIDNLKRKSGISELFFVMQSTRGDGAAFIAPVSGITDQQQEFCKQLAEKHHLNCALYQDKYLVATRAPLREFGAFYKDFKASQNKPLNAILTENSDKILVVACGRLKIRPFFHMTIEEGQASARIRQYDPFANSPRSIKDLVETFDASFVQGAAYVDLSSLRFHYTLQFTTSINAGSFNTSLKDALDAYNAYYFKTLEKKPTLVNYQSFSPGKNLTLMSPVTVEKYNLFGIWRELNSGAFRSVLPVQKDTSLVFNDSVASEVSKVGPNAIAVLGIIRFILNMTEQGQHNNSKGSEASPTPFKRVN